MVFLLGQDWLHPQTVYQILQRLDAYLSNRLLLEKSPQIRSQCFAGLRRIRATTGIYHLRTQLRGSAREAPVTLAGCVLGIGPRRKCTDARDLVYGMLGIASDLKIVCDYTLSVEEVQLDFIYQSLKSGDLTALHYCKNEQSPSFVPCLGPRFDTEYLPVRSSASPFKAGQKFSVDLKVNEDQTLSLQGITIDEVRDLEPLDDLSGNLDSQSSATYMAEVLQDVLHCLRDHYRHIENDQHRHLDREEPVMEYETIFEVIGKSMDPDVSAPATNDNKIRSKRNWLSAPVNKFRHQTRLTVPTLDDLHHWQIVHKSMFRTACGYIGFGVHSLHPGDLVVIFDGAKTPFLVRKEMDEHDNHTGRYRLISDC